MLHYILVGRALPFGSFKLCKEDVPGRLLIEMPYLWRITEGLSRLDPGRDFFGTVIQIGASRDYDGKYPLAQLWTVLGNAV